MANKFLNIPLPVGNGAGPVVDVSMLDAERTFTLDGTLPGAGVTVEGSIDGVSFVPLRQFNKPLKKVIFGAFKFVRARVSGRTAIKPFSANLDVGANDNGCQFVTLPTSPVNGPGPAVDVSHLGSFSTFVVTGDFERAGLTIEASQDGVSWVTCTKNFNNSRGGFENRTLAAKFFRAVTTRRLATMAFAPVVAVGASNDPLSSEAEEDGPTEIDLAIQVDLLGDQVTNLTSLVNSLIEGLGNQGDITDELEAQLEAAESGLALVNANTDFREDPRTPTGPARGDLTGFYPGPRIAPRAVSLDKALVDISGEITATGAAQTIAHNLGVLPQGFFVALVAGHDGAGGPGTLMPASIVEGISTVNDVTVTIDQGTRFKIFVWG